MKFITTILLILHTKFIASQSKSFELKLNSAYSGSVKSGEGSNFKLISNNNNAFTSLNIPNNQLYISLTLCSPSTNDAPDLDLYYSTTESSPGPNKGDKLHNNFTPENYAIWKGIGGRDMPKGILLGTVLMKAGNLDNGFYLTVVAGGNNIEYKFQLAVNTVSYYHNYSTTNGLVLLDTDDVSASFAILSKDSPPKFDNGTQILYYRPAGDSTLYTTCSLQSNKTPSSQSESNKIHTGGKLPKQFMGTEAVITELSRDASYEALLVTNGVSGSTTFNIPIPYKTTEFSDCKLMNQLEFCDMVSYSVPLPNKFIQSDKENQPTVNLDQTKKAYDDYAKNMYKKFESLIFQYDCDAHVYSPVRNCTDCQAAYKDWLCAMTFPRCVDHNRVSYFSESVAVRNPDDKTKEHLGKDLSDTNQYYEIMPCIDLCYYVVQSCPVAFDFTCPEAKSTLKYTYAMNTTEFTNITSWLPKNEMLGGLPFGCNNMMQPVSAGNPTEIIQFSKLISFMFLIWMTYSFTV